MTRGQVWKTLGLEKYRGSIGGRGSGPVGGFDTVYWIGPYNLDLVFDDRSTPGRLKSAALLKRRR
jgi:hypothetical protein